MRTVSYTHTDIHTLTSRISLSFSHRRPKYSPSPTRLPRSYVSRRHPGPMYVILTPFTTQHHASLTSLSSPSLILATGFPVTPPEPGPAPSPAPGYRPSGLPTPVSPGVPTGVRNLGVCVSSCFAPNLCYCLPPFSPQTLSLNLCYYSSAFSLISLSTLNLCYAP